MQGEFKKYLVQRALLKLPETQRIVLVFHDLEEMTAPEIASILSIYAYSVKSQTGGDCRCCDLSLLG